MVCMNWMLVSLVLIVYPLFGVVFYLVRNKLAHIKEFHVIVFAPALISFVLGIGLLAFALTI